MRVTAVPLPPGVLAFAERGPDWAAFVDRLPRLLRELTEEWGLVVDGEPLHGYCSLVVPVRRGGEPAMLKLAFPDDESEHEALGLQRWGGDGAVRLLARRPAPQRAAARAAAPDRPRPRRVLEACEVVAGLYARLHVPALPQLRPLTSYIARWTASCAALPRDAPVPHRLVAAGGVAGPRPGQPTRPARACMIHGDLHYENVLAGDREPWLVIDPKPVSGDPHYELAPMLWNRWDEAVASGDVRAAVRRRFHTLVDAAGSTRTGPGTGSWSGCCTTRSGSSRTTPTAPDHDYLTMCIAIAKAVQD